MRTPPRGSETPFISSSRRTDTLGFEPRSESATERCRHGRGRCGSQVGLDRVSSSIHMRFESDAAGKLKDGVLTRRETSRKPDEVYGVIER
jgi:hypothetical protein